MSELDRSDTAHRDGVDLLEVVRRTWMRASVIAFVTVLLGCAFAVLRPARYLVEASFIPQGGRAAGTLAGLAAQLRANVSVSDASTNPQFFAALMKSRQVLTEVISPDSSGHGGAGSSLFDRLSEEYGVTDESPNRRRVSVVKRLQKRVDAEVATKTGVITTQVRDGDSTIALLVARRLLTVADGVSSRAHREAAAAERRFADGRLAEVGIVLRSAEETLERFQSRNRDALSAPGPRLEQVRLERDLDLKQRLYLEIAQAQELAWLEEFRQTPSIAVIDQPTLPVAPEPRFTFAWIAACAAAGLVLGFAIEIFRVRSRFLPEDQPARSHGDARPTF
jgi:uncharacterized protein involved in exopolysaccharide biosynthesis